MVAVENSGRFLGVNKFQGKRSTYENHIATLIAQELRGVLQILIYDTSCSRENDFGIASNEYLYFLGIETVLKEIHVRRLFFPFQRREHTFRIHRFTAVE